MSSMMSALQHRGRISATSLRAVVAFAAVLMPATLAAQSRPAKSFSVLYSFKGKPDGAQPYAGLVQDASGTLYGTTDEGGEYNWGTVFKLDDTGKETVLHSFAGDKDGEYPWAGLVLDNSGNLYGTASEGGAGACYEGYQNVGCGIVFALDRTGKETILHTFTGGADGSWPYYGYLVRDKAGTLYGTTYYGGSDGISGTVYKIDPDGKETVLHSFNGNDGAYPSAGVMRDSSGNLYGTALIGGQQNGGTVFKFTSSGKFSVLHNFSDGTDGGWLEGELVRDSFGNLYGTSLFGGKFYQYGTVFKLSKNGKETVLYSFTGGADGAVPYAGLVRDSSGNLYGTTAAGGAHGQGVVFKLDPAGKETVLHSFTGGKDGGVPYASLLLAKDRTLYGTTAAGGSGFGVVFSVKP
jgi:uncharacterized repeat protein (TIGR03803 family)